MFDEKINEDAIFVISLLIIGAINDYVKNFYRGG